MATWMWRLVAAGALLGALELSVVALRDRDLFLSSLELGRYGLFSCSLLSVVLMTLGLFGLFVHRLAGADPRRSERLLSCLVGLSAAPWGWSLTAGRRVRDQPLRPVFVGLFALLAAAAVYWGGRALRKRLEGPNAATWAALLMGLAAAVMWADSAVLRRLYPSFHVGLAVVACGLSAFATLGFDFLREPPGPARVWVAALSSLWLLTGAQWYGLLSAPNARFAVEQAAPVSGKLLSLSSRLRPETVEPAPSLTSAEIETMAGPVERGPGVDLRQRDVLIITVDALRADRLAAYGGSGLTPAMDALAEQSFVFERAYTTAPHTSYAMASLMTGKYMREVLALPGKGHPHATLAHTVRRYGYRTAAFYPPALFFVDEDAFAELSREQFGFEYAKVMFASAQERVEQLRTYLELTEGDHPLLLWVHLFEPHEPYEPAPEFERGGSPVQRYDGEVAQADAAVGELLGLLRKKRKEPPLVVMTADHGEEFQDHGGYRHGTTLFDEQVRVPLLFSAPGTILPGRSGVAVDHVDIATTVLAALGMPREARMLGDDLGPLLAGGSTQKGRAYASRAYASVEAQRMLTDGRYKLVCASRAPCRLYDLQRDPHERRDVAAPFSERVEALKADLSRLSASIAGHEALDVDGAGLPEVLSRVKLGEPVGGEELARFLGDSRPAVRALAAAACGEQGYRPALPLLHNLRGHDPQPQVRDEATLSLFRLGERGRDVDMTALLGAGRELALRRRVALALADADDPRGLALLRDLASDQGAEELSRRAAVVALGRLSHEGEGEASARTLIALLSEVRLRPHVAAALGSIGTPRAREALLSALAHERYMDCRVAEAQALTALGERRAVPHLVRFLGTSSGLPGGLGWLQRLSALRPYGGALAREPGRARVGFECVENRCDFEGEATLRLRRPVPRRGALVVLEVEVHSDGAELGFGDQLQRLHSGAQQAIFALEGGAREVTLRATQPLRVGRFGVFARREDIAPPPPEPWQALEEQADAGVAAPPAAVSPPAPDPTVRRNGHGVAPPSATIEAH